MPDRDEPRLSDLLRLPPEPGSVPALRAEEPQPRRYAGERRRQENTIVVKVRTPPARAVRALRTVAVAPPAAMTATVAAAIPPALAELIQNGRIRQVVPVLPTTGVDASSPHRALMADDRVRRAYLGI